MLNVYIIIGRLAVSMQFTMAVVGRKAASEFLEVPIASEIETAL